MCKSVSVRRARSREYLGHCPSWWLLLALSPLPPSAQPHGTQIPLEKRCPSFAWHTPVNSLLCGQQLDYARLRISVRDFGCVYGKSTVLGAHSMEACQQLQPMEL